MVLDPHSNLDTQIIFQCGYCRTGISLPAIQMSRSAVLKSQHEKMNKFLLEVCRPFEDSIFFTRKNGIIEEKEKKWRWEKFLYVAHVQRLLSWNATLHKKKKTVHKTTKNTNILFLPKKRQMLTLLGQVYDTERWIALKLFWKWRQTWRLTNQQTAK